MKKILTIVLASLMLFACFAVAASAAGISANEQKVIDHVSSLDASGLSVDKDFYVKRLQNLANANDVEITDSMANQIISEIDAAFAAFKATGSKNGVDLTSAQRNAIASNLNAAAQVVGWGVICSNGKDELYIYNQDNELIDTLGGVVIKKTGSDNAIFYVVVAVSLLSLAVALFATQKKRA